MTHRNADQRIRDAFDALRAEIEAVFPDAPATSIPTAVIKWSRTCEDALHDFAKLPADA